MQIIDIPNELLMGKDVRCFNNSIINYQGRTFMLYRYEPYGTYATEIAMCELDQGFMPVGPSKKIRIPRMTSRIETLDDPRAFLYKNELWFTHAQGALYSEWQWSASLCVAKTDENGLCNNCYLPNFGKNYNYATKNLPKASEKSWSPFIHEGKLHMVYLIDTLTIIEYDPKADFVKQVETSRDKIPYSWDHGKPYGGTQLINRNGGYFGIFHSYTITNPNMPNCRTYHIGAYSIKKGPDGFYVDRMSTKPIITAVEEPERDMRANRAGWRPNCVYPCGLIEMNSRVYMSYGWQDCRCSVAEMTWEEIEQNMETIDYGRPIRRSNDSGTSTGNDRIYERGSEAGSIYSTNANTSDASGDYRSETGDVPNPTQQGNSSKFKISAAELAARKSLLTNQRTDLISQSNA